MITEISFNDTIAPIWKDSFNSSSLRTPFSTYGWQKTFLSTIGVTAKPYFLYHPELHCIAPFIRKDATVEFSGGVEVSDYMDLIGPDEAKDKAWTDIITYLRNHGVSHLELRNIPESSATLAFFRKNNPDSHLTVETTPEDSTPVIHFPETYALYLDSLERKARHEAERKIRKFERENPDHTMSDGKDVENGIGVFIDMMRTDQEKSKFLAAGYEAFFRLLPAAFPDDIRIFIVSVSQIPAAAIMAFIMDNSFFLYNSGFNQSNFSGAGFYLKAKSIQWAIEHGLSKYNFLQGHERYKYDLGGKDFGVFTVTLSFRT